MQHALRCKFLLRRIEASSPNYIGKSFGEKLFWVFLD